jgi:hypothetical protein
LGLVVVVVVVVVMRRVVEGERYKFCRVLPSDGGRCSSRAAKGSMKTKEFLHWSN